MANIYFSHGDKGGVGKSMLSSLLLDYLMAKGEKLAIIEGDKSMPDVAFRFGDLPMTGVDMASKTPEKTALDFMDAVNQLKESADHIVVNMPASAGETADEIADILIMALAADNHASHVFYSVGRTESATEALIKSAKSGLFAAVPSSSRFLVFHEFSAPAKKTDLWTSGRHKKLEFSNALTIPEIQPDALLAKVLQQQSSFSDLVSQEGEGLTLIEKMLLQKRFLAPAHAEIETALTK